MTNLKFDQIQYVRIFLGLFLGMSSGGIVWAALQVARELGPGKRVACISPDGGWKYLSTPLYAEP